MVRSEEAVTTFYELNFINFAEKYQEKEREQFGGKWLPCYKLFKLVGTCISNLILENIYVYSEAHSQFL